jgi:hypothetical protein
VGKVEVLAALREAVRAAGGIRRFADQRGVNAGSVCQILNGKLEPTEGVVNAIGYMAITVYRPIVAATRNAA